MQVGFQAFCRNKYFISLYMRMLKCKDKKHRRKDILASSSDWLSKLFSISPLLSQKATEETELANISWIFVFKWKTAWLVPNVHCWSMDYGCCFREQNCSTVISHPCDKRRASFLLEGKAAVSPGTQCMEFSSFYEGRIVTYLTSQIIGQGAG